MTPEQREKLKREIPGAWVILHLSEEFPGRDMQRDVRTLELVNEALDAAAELTERLERALREMVYECEAASAIVAPPPATKAARALLDSLVSSEPEGRSTLNLFPGSGTEETR